MNLSVILADAAETQYGLVRHEHETVMISRLSPGDKSNEKVAR